MILLRMKHEEDKDRLEKRLQADMEAQKVQMMNMMKANIKEARKEKETAVDQNKALKNSIAEMQRSLNELNRQIECLKKRIWSISFIRPIEPAANLQLIFLKLSPKYKMDNDLLK